MFHQKYVRDILKTERFDREDGEKIFSITFAGILWSNADLELHRVTIQLDMKLVNILTKAKRMAKQLDQMFRVDVF